MTKWTGPVISGRKVDEPPHGTAAGIRMPDCLEIRVYEATANIEVGISR